MDDTILETERLILRRFVPQDLQDLFAYLSDAEVVRFEPYRPMSLKETAENLRWRISTDEMIAVVLKSNCKLIGNIYLGKRDFEALELGYVFHRDFWGRGFAREACTAMIQHAFAGGTHRIFAECDVQNVSSWKLLESLGFERSGHLKQNVYFWKDENGNPIWKDTYIYALLQP